MFNAVLYSIGSVVSSVLGVEDPRFDVAHFEHEKMRLEAARRRAREAQALTDDHSSVVVITHDEQPSANDQTSQSASTNPPNKITLEDSPSPRGHVA